MPSIDRMTVAVPTCVMLVVLLELEDGMIGTDDKFSDYVLCWVGNECMWCWNRELVSVLLL